jgi:YihY family inner membrane protein
MPDILGLKEPVRFNPGLLARAGRALSPTARYWMQTEAHVYAFAVSASILLSFFPFLIVILSLCQHVLKWRAAVDAIYFALNDYFPDPLGDFIRRNLRATVASRGPLQTFSIVLLLFTANGIFEPLEVALNRIWNCPRNRTYLRNQLVSLGLIFACGGLVLISTTLTALDRQFLTQVNGWAPGLAGFLGPALFKAAAVPVSMLMLLLIYWLLPNCRVRVTDILPAAIGVGLLLELLKYVNLLIWPLLRNKLALEYGPFVYSVSIILWGVVASMIILAGAEWAARRAQRTIVNTL